MAMMRQNRSLRISLLSASLILFLGFILFKPASSKSEPKKTNNQVVDQNATAPKCISLKIVFAIAPTILDVQKAALRYNKDFAYSFNVADGLIDAYSVAFPLLKGGCIEGNKTISKGYFYSDGCGNLLPFSASLSWYSVNSYSRDIHVNTPGYVTWDQLKIMYEANWNVLNHSYSHSVDSTTDFAYEIKKNQEYVKQKAGIDMNFFVPPSGVQEYVSAAFENGNVCVVGNTREYRGYPTGYRVDSTIDFKKFMLFKMLLCDANQDTSNIMRYIDIVASNSKSGQHFWWNDFTHHVGFQKSGASLYFPLFKFYMESVANKYGANGLDNMWMAGTQDVFEYLQVRDNAQVKFTLDDRVLSIVIDCTKIPTNLHSKALTLNILSDQEFTEVGSENPCGIKFNGKGDKKLININW